MEENGKSFLCRMERNGKALGDDIGQADMEWCEPDNGATFSGRRKWANVDE